MSHIFKLLTPGSGGPIPTNPQLAKAWQELWERRYAQTWKLSSVGLVPANAPAPKRGQP